MNDEELHKVMFNLMQSYFNDIDQPRSASEVEFDNGDVVQVSESANRAVQTHQTVLDGADEWLRARLADEGLELLDRE
jgi:hypothetical protein